MIFSEEVFELEDCVQELSQKIIESQIVRDYVNSKREMNHNPETSLKIDNFIKAKDQFEQIESYGKYAPDFQEKKRKLRSEKRKLDMDDLVGDYRYKERTLQDLLDHVTYEIANSVSDTIKINAGNPFFEMAQKGCGGDCHVG